MPKILIVDDEWITRLEIEEMLTDLGYEVVGKAQTSSEAITLARELDPDLILMDIVMPGDMDGISAAEKIKRESDIPIVFITGYAEPECVERAKAVEPFGYVMKPFDEKEIRAVLEIALHKSKMELQLKKSRRALETEIENRKKVEAALTKSKRLLNETQMLTKIGGWEYDVGEQRIAWTDQVYRIYGVNRESFDPNDLEKTCSFYAPEDRKKVEKAFTAAWNKGRSYDLELRFMSAKGEDLWVRTIGKPVLENGKVTKVVGNIMDITEPKKLRETLRQAQKMKTIGILAGGIAHDYNNLLAVIMGNLSLAQEEAEPNSAIAKFLHEIEQASYKTKDLTRQFLTLSQGGHLGKKRGSMETLIKEILGQFAVHEASTNLSIADDLWPVEYDSRQMHLAISNLIINAVEAMPQGGSVALQVENLVIENKYKEFALFLDKGRYVRISIRDEGGGIPEEHLNRIFDPYFSTKERGVQKGMGLGLTAAYAVVEKHGGHIMVNSTIGAGTTVTIYLPAAEEKGKGQISVQKSTDTAASINSGQRPTKRILAMDDEKSLRDLVQKMLEQLGYEVEVVKDGMEAIETYKKNMGTGEPFDGVILDLTIKGGMGGDQAIKELIKIDPDVKAIVCSGYFNNPVLANYAENGFRDALPKPYTMNDLERVLTKVMG